MDRRGFLKALGIGGALVVATPQLVLAATTKVATPERRVFVPPNGGWLAWGEGDATSNDATWSRAIPGTDLRYFDSLPRWTLDIERFDQGGGPVPSFTGPTQIGGVEGWLQAWDQTMLRTDAVRVHERYVGYGVPPHVRTLNVKAQLRLERPELPFYMR